jgi:hypothetical protein
MMRIFLIAVASLLSAVHIGGAYGESRDREHRVDEMLTLAGVRAAIAQLAQQAQHGVPTSARQLSADQQAMLSRIVGHEFREGVVYDLVKARLRNRVDDNRVAAALAYLRTPLAQAMHRLEVEASGPGVEVDLQRFADELRTNPPDEGRLAAIRRLERAMRATDFSFDLVIATVRGMAAAIDPTLPPHKRLKPGELNTIERRLRRETRGAMEQATLFRMLYTYRSATDAELVRYAETLETDTGRWVTDVLSRSLIEAFAAVMGRVASQMAQAKSPQGLAPR